MGDIWQKIVDVWQEAVRGNVLVDLLVKTIESLVLFIVFIVLGRASKRYIVKLASRTSRNANFAALMGNLAYISLLVIVVFVILTIYTGAGLSSLLTLFGFVGLALSFALQDILKNFIAGIYILLEQPFKIGDIINVKEMSGKVESIEIRTTNLQTENGLQVIIPNWIIFSEIVINRTAYDRRLVTVRITLPPGSDLGDATRRVGDVFKTFSAQEVVTKPAPTVLLENTLDNKTTARIEFWTPGQSGHVIGPKVALAIKQALPEADVATAQ